MNIHDKQLLVLAKQNRNFNAKQYIVAPPKRWFRSYVIRIITEGSNIYTDFKFKRSVNRNKAIKELQRYGFILKTIDSDIRKLDANSIFNTL